MLASRELLRGTVPHAIKNFTDPINGNISVGIFGVMYDMKNSSKGLYWRDPIETAREQVAALQAQNVDLIIALTHQDLVDDNRLSEEVGGIDLIIGGHDHSSMLQTHYGTPYIKSDFNFRSIWKTHIEYYAADASYDRKVVMTHQTVPIVESMPSDSNLDATIAAYQAQMETLEEQIIGNLCEDLALSQNVVRTKDCKIGHLFADAALQYYGKGSADVAVVNGGCIRGDKVVAAGDLTMGDLLSWSPFRNRLMTIQTNGASLKLFLDHEMARSCGSNTIEQNGFYVHLSGFSYTYTRTREGVGTISSLVWLDHPINSGEIKDSDEFVMALTNYLYSTEFVVIDGVNATVKVSEVEADRVDSALEAYISRLSNGTVCLQHELRSSVSF